MLKLEQIVPALFAALCDASQLAGLNASLLQIDKHVLKDWIYYFSPEEIFDTEIIQI